MQNKNRNGLITLALSGAVVLAATFALTASVQAITIVGKGTSSSPSGTAASAPPIVVVTSAPGNAPPAN